MASEISEPGEGGGKREGPSGLFLGLPFCLGVLYGKPLRRLYTVLECDAQLASVPRVPSGARRPRKIRFRLFAQKSTWLVTFFPLVRLQSPVLQLGTRILLTEGCFGTCPKARAARRGRRRHIDEQNITGLGLGRVRSRGRCWSWNVGLVGESTRGCPSRYWQCHALLDSSQEQHGGDSIVSGRVNPASRDGFTLPKYQPTLRPPSSSHDLQPHLRKHLNAMWPPSSRPRHHQFRHR